MSRPARLAFRAGRRVVVPVLVIASIAAQAADFAETPTERPHPLASFTVWLPMTGWTDDQMEEAARAGYNTVLFKIHPPVAGEAVDFAGPDAAIDAAERHGMRCILAILGWVGLGDGAFWDTKENGEKIPNRLDPFWPEAMDRVEWYFGEVLDRYRDDARVVAFAPTWGIYGEAGFTSFDAGRSRHALVRFNEWRENRRLALLDRLPTRRHGPNTEYNSFIRFRYLYVERQFRRMIERLKTRAGGRPVGMWQELYPVSGYLWNMVEVPTADFALYESCFSYQTSHDVVRALGETMGFRYRCRSADDYRDYYLPLLARKRGEGQRFMGCQLSNSYATNYGWTEDDAERIGFDKWEDAFCPCLKALNAARVDVPAPDVLLVFPTYAAAALSDDPCHAADARIIDVMLRMHGCAVRRIGSPRLDRMTKDEFDAYRLVIVPCASFVLAETLDRLAVTRATVMLTGCLGQSLDGVLVPFGDGRDVIGRRVEYRRRLPGLVDIAVEHALTRGLAEELARHPCKLPQDESFAWADGEDEDDRPEVVLTCGGEPLVSLLTGGTRWIVVHGHLLAGVCHDPDRTPPAMAGSNDASANEADIWGPYSSAHPGNGFARRFMGALLEYAGADVRVPNPSPRTFVPYLGDHMEPASVSANLAYNNTATPVTLTVRMPYPVADRASRKSGDHWLSDVKVPPFSYLVLRPAPE